MHRAYDGHNLVMSVVKTYVVIHMGIWFAERFRHVGSRELGHIWARLSQVCSVRQAECSSIAASTRFIQIAVASIKGLNEGK
jgi:hypothetical protein